MTLPAAQYAAMRTVLRAALSGNYPGIANPSDGEVLSFFNQLFTDSSGATALSSAKQNAMSAACRSLVCANLPGVSNPNDADIVAFLSQIQSDASGAASLTALRYAALKTVLADVLSNNMPGATNPSQSDLLGYFGQFGGGAAILSGFTDLTLSGTNTYFWDTGAYTLTGSAPNQYYSTDAFARVILTTSVTSLIVEAVAPAAGENESVGVWVNGVYNQAIVFTNYGVKQQITITLPAGAKTVELVCRAHVTGVSATAYSLVAKPATVARRCVVVGDSIAAGNLATPVQLGYVPTKLRHGARFDGITDFSVSGDELFAHSGSITAFAASIAARLADATTERVVLLALATNDFGLDHWSASSFQPVAVSLLNAIRAGDPTIQVYWCTAFHRGNEATPQPIHGSVMSDFAAAITAACASANTSAGATFCRAIDGLTAFTFAQANALPDKLHPDTALHAQIGEWILDQFGNLQATVASATLVNATLTTDSPATIMAGSIKAGYIPETGLSATGWTDVGPNHLNLTGTCTVVSSALNGFSGAQFASASSNKLTVSTTHPDPATQPLVFWGVVRQDSWTNNTGVICAGQTTGNYEVIQSGSSPQLKQFSTLGVFGPANSGAPISAFKRIEADITGGTGDTLIAGSVSVTGTHTSPTGTIGQECIQLGSGNGTFANCTWLEFWVFTAVPTGAQRTALDSYVSNKYGAGANLLT